MSRFSAMTCVALVAVPSFAVAANPRIVMTVSAADARAKLVAAANLVCQQALSNDAFGDFGPREECVTDAIRSAVVRPAAEAHAIP